jgi:exosortase
MSGTARPGNDALALAPPPIMVDHRSMAGVPEHSLAQTGVMASHRGAVIAGAVLVALTTVLFWDFVGRQLRFAIREQADWGHTLVIPLIAGYFVYLNREKLLARPFRTTWIGLIPVIAGVAFYMFCSFGMPALRHHNVQALGVASTITGIVLLFCGFRAMLWLWFPLCYLFLFGQTISPRFMQIVTFQLQDITAFGAHKILLLMTLDVELEGNTLIVYHDGVSKPLNVAEACSGMRMLMAFLALGVAMAFTGLKRFWQQALLVAMGVPVAIFVNMLRVVTLALLSLLDSSFAAGDFHSFIGLVWLLPAFLLFLGVMWIIRSLVIEEEPA